MASALVSTLVLWMGEMDVLVWLEYVYRKKGLKEGKIL